MISVLTDSSVRHAGGGLSPLFLYILAINVLGFVTAALDKLFACRHRQRVPERTLFLLAAVGGSVGIYTALLLFRHKTQRTSFMAGIPGIFLVQLFLLYLWAR